MNRDPGKYASVRGRVVPKRDLASWTPEQYITYFQFVLFFFVPTPEGPRIKESEEKWFKSEEFLDMPDHPFQEFLWRIDKFTFSRGVTKKAFYFKLSVQLQMILKYLQANPVLISTKLKELIEPYPRLNWCLTQTKVAMTEMGVPVVIPQNDKILSIDQQLEEAHRKLVNLAVLVAESITPQQIKKMKTRDKMNLLGKLNYLWTVRKTMRSVPKVLTQININAASRDELEKMAGLFARQPE